MAEEIIFSNNPGESLSAIVEKISPSKVVAIIDSKVEATAIDLLNRSLPEYESISISGGDENKHLKSLTQLWDYLIKRGANRKSLIINIGGGAVTDIGGFAAATFKRGIRYINMPTTLLAAIDASVGGKTAINYQGLKNEIGAFHLPSATIISTRFFETLPVEEILSGYGEMLKHALLSDENLLSELLTNDPLDITPDEMLHQVKKSVMVKQHIVNQDPLENGLRRALNLGHTLAHALESRAIAKRQPLSHGRAVAYGLIEALILSHLKLQFPSDTLHRLSTYIKETYGAYPITCEAYPTLLEYMHHDKKNEDHHINFTLMRQIGSPAINIKVSDEEVRTALDIFQDIMS